MRTHRPLLSTRGAACWASSAIWAAVNSTSSKSTDHRTCASSAAVDADSPSSVVSRRLGRGVRPALGTSTSKPASRRMPPPTDMTSHASSSVRIASPRLSVPARVSSGTSLSARIRSSTNRAPIFGLGCDAIALSMGCSTSSGSRPSTCRCHAPPSVGGSSLTTNGLRGGSATGFAHSSRNRTSARPRFTGARKDEPSRRPR